jgi:hypothetical protein
MKIGRKLFPKLNKDKFKYEIIEDYINDEVADAYLTFNIKNKIVTLQVDWAEDFDVDELVSLLFLMATGEIVGPIFHELVGTHEADEVDYIKQSLTAKLKEYRDKMQGEGEVDEDEEPLVAPISAFVHLMSVNNPGTGE